MKEYMNAQGDIFPSMDALISDAMESFEQEINAENGPEAAKWIQDGEDYIPAPNIKISEKLPNGAYKIVETREDTKLVPIKLNTDELFTFSEDSTTSILNEVQNFWDRKEIYKDHNITHKRGILLCGAPGCGKTSIINLLVQQLKDKDGIIFMISSSREFDVYMGMLKPIIRKIEPERPIITIIEDVNQIIGEVGSDYRILDFMDGKNSIENHLVILTSNDTTDLSDALLRPSRIDLTYEIKNPSAKIRKEYFEKKGINPEKMDDYVAYTDGFSFAELKEVYIGTEVLGKDLESTIKQITSPFECKDYLNKTRSVKIKGFE